MGTRADRDRLLDRIDAGVVHGQLARAWQAALKLLPAEVRKVEHHAAVNATTVGNFFPLGARHDVAGGQLHRVRRVSNHETVAVLVAEVPALTAAALGDEHAVRLEGRRVELQEFHVLERHAGVPGQRHAVTGARERVGRAVVHAADATRREDHVVRLNGMEAAALGIPSDHAGALPAVNNDLRGKELLVDLDLVLDELLIEHVDQDVASDVGRVDRARRASSAERALRELAIGSAREDRAHVLKLVDVAGRLLGEDLDRVLVAQIIRALDGVEGVRGGRILRRIAERSVDAALCRAGMGTGRMQFRDDSDINAGPLRLDRCAHACEARTEDNYVMSNH